MDSLVPEAISLILRLGAMMVLAKAGFMSLCHSLHWGRKKWNFDGPAAVVQCAWVEKGTH